MKLFEKKSPAVEMLAIYDVTIGYRSGSDYNDHAHQHRCLALDVKQAMSAFKLKPGEYVASVVMLARCTA